MAGLGLAAIALGLIDGEAWRAMALVAGGAMLCVLAAISGAGLWHWRQKREGIVASIAQLLEQDEAACFVADAEGEVLYRSLAAGPPPDDHPNDTMAFAFSKVLANPGAVLFRLQSRAAAEGHAREDVVTRNGNLRLSVHRMQAHAFVWRAEDMGERPQSRATEGLSLPMLTAGPSGTVLFMNEASRRLFGGRVKSLDRIFRDLPLESGRLHRMDTVDGLREAIIAVVAGAGGRSEVYVLPGTGPASAASSWDAIEDLPVPLMRIAVTGEILGSNQEARSLLSVASTEGARLSDLLEGLGRPIIDWLRETATGQAMPGPQFLRGTGERQETFVRLALNRTGRPADGHLIGVLSDVTELKSLEAQFVQSQKMQAIGQLAGGIAHDFNNLLTAISGHCDLLLLRHDQGDQDYADLVQIHQNSNRAASLVSQLLAFSRKQNLRPELLDLRDTLADLTHLLNRLVGERVRLILNHDPELKSIRADKRQLEQVIMNLVVNARDAMPGGGEILVETRNVDFRQPLERDNATVPAGSYVEVDVTDQGHGIPPDKLKKIWEPFFTTKRTGEGTGLGLSTAYGIVKQTGGYIFVDSQVNQGTTFRLYFPAFQALPEPVQPILAAPAERRGAGVADGVILLVEDEAPVRAFASRALRLRGYTVLEADCAETALEMLADPELLVDLFVTDVIMPGMDGPSWVSEAIEARKGTPVVFVSGYAEDAFGEKQVRIPNSVFLAKPFSLSDLTATVEKQMELATARSARPD